jgi:hypothetical protein
MQKGESGLFACEIYFSCREDMIEFSKKPVERVLELGISDLPRLNPVDTYLLLINK